MTTIELIFAIFGWVFGLISTVCAIIQSVLKNKYKQLYKKQLYNNQSVTAGNDAKITQIGGINIE